MEKKGRAISAGQKGASRAKKGGKKKKDFFYYIIEGEKKRV